VVGESVSAVAEVDTAMLNGLVLSGMTSAQMGCFTLAHPMRESSRQRKYAPVTAVGEYPQSFVDTTEVDEPMSALQRATSLVPVERQVHWPTSPAKSEW
jgi:hypothetical protein